MTEIIAEKRHAVLGPSSWDRWSTCPGSVVMEEGRPDTVSSYAAWGSVAHEIADQCLRDGCDAETFVDRTFSVDGHEIEVDMEMADCVNTYISVVHWHIDVAAGDILLHEQEVPIGHLTGEAGAVGTADCIGLVNGGTKLVVIDLKGGRGVMVSAEGNGQGRMYALGALEKFGAIYEDIAEVEIVISQPRVSEEPSVEVLSIDELLEFADEIRAAAYQVQLASNLAYDEQHMLVLVPSEKACKFCKAKADCPALRAEVEGSLAGVSQAADADEFADLTLPKKASSVVIDDSTDVERLAEFMRAAPLIEDAIKAVRAEVERRLLAGESVPGWKVVQGKRGNRAWSDAAVAEAELKKRYKVDEMYTKKVISPTAAEKLCKSQPKIWSKIAPLIVQPEGKPSVAPKSDPRPALQLGASADDFAVLSAEPVAQLEDRASRMLED